ncbi:MAG: DNA-3-methyladenine glycosylase 2 family protein [Clostridia bacterium]|nr:DNA-3-methyladenine glycosylase 2 family protein [Clostridia bacterium]
MPTKTETIIANADELDICKTFECGQCFRWKAEENGSYIGVAAGKILRVRSEGGNIVADCGDDAGFWHDYFDLDTDYVVASSLFAEPEYLKTCASYGAGIRILRQEPWETLCSFIISQCNNIPRIKTIVDTLCAMYGEELAPGLFSFPTADRLAPLSENDLAPLHSGYRAQYILDAARAVAEGTLDFEELLGMDSAEAFASVKRLSGVGDKVANCFMLYGLHRMDRFPVDVWMKRALKAHFPENYDPTVLGDFAGLAQQYIFYYARTQEGAIRN